MTDGRPSGGIPRYHALDRLRAAMMLLGVVRHAAMSYVPTVFEGWPYQDAQVDGAVYGLIAFIRVFQLPVFFAIAGFFGAYLVATRGTRGFLRNRWSRIGVPFVVGWPLLAVAMYFLVPFAARFSHFPPGYTYGLVEITSPQALDYLFMHLWFLYHLLILCAAASLVRLVVLRIPERARSRALDWFERGIHRGGVVLLALAAGLALYQMRSWAIDYYGGPFPGPRLLALYGLFFGFGWLLFLRRGALDGFKRRPWIHLGVAVLCFFVHRHFVDAGCFPIPNRSCTGTAVGPHLGAVAFIALSMATMAYGLIGLFLRHMNKPNPRWRYMADASYWIYLVHVPVVMLLPILLAGAALPAFVKLALVVAVATALILVSYRYLVRPTFIGKQLNGRRYPRGLVKSARPASTPAPRAPRR